MLNRFREYIRNENLFADDQKVLLAVSGGLDSVVMAHLFDQSGFKFGVVHCNFQLRGEESDKDEKLVADMAGEMGVPFYSRRFDTESYARKHKLSVQMTARELRYAYFEELRNEKSYDFIASAHHLDDQIETFFINILRGSGIAGLHGIRAKTGRIVRPLLFAGRSEIEAYCKRKCWFTAKMPPINQLPICGTRSGSGCCPSWKRSIPITARYSTIILTPSAT
ncbi:MAG: tRNA lysidine(34) synthetase TilS [Bacteroidota bacterium]|nr:tRNA lysidine(34) synthetase TilS [Bacteroidota bacterium]